MLKKMFKNIFYYSMKPSSINKKKINTFSYGNFLIKNPKANKIERKKSIKKFFKSTRNVN